MPIYNNIYMHVVYLQHTVMYAWVGGWEGGRELTWGWEIPTSPPPTPPPRMQFPNLYIDCVQTSCYQ